MVLQRLTRFGRQAPGKLIGLGGAAGVVLAKWTLNLLMAFKPPLPVPVQLDVSPDRTVLLFTLGVSLLASLLFGVAPALQATNPDVASRRRWRCS